MNAQDSNRPPWNQALDTPTRSLPPAGRRRTAEPGPPADRLTLFDPCRHRAAPLIGCAAVLWLALGGPVSGDTVTFTVAADSFSTTINALTAGEAGTKNEYTVGILLHITQYNGAPKVLDQFEFCQELAEPVSPGITYTYTVVPLNQLDMYSGGRAGSASAGIPVGGIGDLRAARLNYLFDQYYAGTSASSWTRTVAQPDSIAFQLAVWEITHDADLSLSDPSGSMWIDAAANAGSTLNMNALALAQTWLADVAGANVSPAYTSLKWDLIGLASDGNQDLAIATAKGALVPAPEPASLLIVSVGLSLFLGSRHRGTRQA